MYTTNHRLGGRIAFSGAGMLGLTAWPSIHFSVPTVIEGVYSWRTGRNAISDPPVSPRVKRVQQDGYGVRTPQKSGSLVDRLADRKRYMEEFQRAAFPAETQSGSTSVNRVSKTDSGHLFASHKTFRVPYSGHLEYLEATNRWYSGDIWGYAGNGCYNPSTYGFGFTTNSNGLLTVSSTDRQGMANRYFANTAPDKNVGSLATTLVELLRGDIPSVLKNFREMMAGYRTVRNTLGSDYLNIAFGWTPLIQEYANLIKVGMNLERVVYYESFRRKRQWDGPSTSQRSSGITNINMLTGPYTSAYRHTLPNDVIGPTSGFGSLWEHELSQVESEDYHFASRYTGLAKAGRRAESFSDQAMDVTKRLGLVDDPQMLWDLTPYSWLVDWFTTMGDSISNANVYSPMRGKYDIDYAYLTTQRTQSVEGNLLRLSSPLTPHHKSVRITQSKSSAISVTRWRDRATPFGFGTQLGSLSASQFAILVALGFAQNR